MCFEINSKPSGRCECRRLWVVGLPTPPTGFAKRRASQGIHVATSPLDRIEGLHTSMSSAHLQRRRAHRWRPWAGRHLSWGSSQVAPPPSHTSCPLQRQAALACGHHPANIGASPNTLHVSFRPRSFSLPRRIAPACVRRFVAPCSGHGVRKISSVAAPLGTPHHPKCAQTLQRFPLADSSTASPRPIPS